MSGLHEIGGFFRRIFTSVGDLLVGTASGGYKRLPIGTAGQVLTVNASATDLEWSASAGGLDAEAVRDTIGTAMTAGAGISVTVNDPADTITVASTITQYTDEMARDALGTALTAGAGITITPNDVADTITVASTITQYTDEQVRDVMGTALIAGVNLTSAVNDPGDTITLDVDDAFLLNTGDTGNGNYTIIGTSNIDFTSAIAFYVRNSGGTITTFVVDTTGNEVELRNGADLRVFSDDGVTEKALIDGTTGNIQTDGDIVSSALVTKTANYTATANDRVILVDASLGAVTITLPAVASTTVGKEYTIVKTDDTINAVTVDGNLSEAVGDFTSQTLNNVDAFVPLYKFITIVNDGTKWQVVADNRMLSEEGGTVAGGVTVNALGAFAFRVQNGSGSDRFRIDTTNAEAELWNGTDLRVYSDNGVTEKASIDGATGNLQTDGTISADGAVDFNSTLNVDGASTLNATTWVKVTDTAAFLVEDAAGADNLVVNTTLGKVRFANATDLEGFSDDYVTEKWSIDGATGNIQSDGSITSSALVNKTANYTATANDEVITCDATTAAFTITLPAVASTTVGKRYCIKKTDASRNEVTIDGNAAETIDGFTSYKLQGRDAAIWVANTGSAWVVIDTVLPRTAYIESVGRDATLGAAAVSANAAYCMRVDIDAPMTISTLSIMQGGTSSGNVDVGVYRSDGTTLTRLTSAGSTVAGAINTRQDFNVADADVFPGQDIYLAYVQDNSTNTIIRQATSSASSEFANRLRAFNASFPLPATLTLSSGVNSTNQPYVLAEA